MKIEKKYTVYMISCPKGLKYIGASSNFNRRKIEHRFYAKIGKTTPIHVAIRKYGEKLIWLEILNGLSKNDAYLKEVELIKFHNSQYPCGYNTNPGGLGNTGKRSYDFKKKVSEFNKGKSLSEETRTKISKAHKGKQFRLGKVHSENTKNKMAENSGKSKLVVDLSCGFVFHSVREAAESKNIKQSTLICYLNGHRPNKTTLRYVETKGD